MKAAGNVKKETERIVHPIAPVYDSRSRVLVLGSFPSVKSRETGFFYGHPQNRFWKVMAAIYGEEVPEGTPARREFLLRHRIAAWDVLQSCEIVGSSDASIRNAVPNDLRTILKAAPVRTIFVNGKTAEKYYRRFTEPLLGRPAVVLPSTSPANAARSLEDLIRAWAVVREETEREPF